MEREVKNFKKVLAFNLKENAAAVVLYHLESPGIQSLVVEYHFESPWQS